MWKGTSALKDIDQSLQTIRHDVVRLDTQLQQLTDNLTLQQRHRLSLVNDIAQVRLNELERGALRVELTAADQHVLAILADRENALNELTAEIDRLNQEISAAEQERESLLASVNKRSQDLVDLEAQVQNRLKQDEAYLRQLADAQQRESIALEAERKVDVAQSDMAEKAAPYQADELFMYLWQRGYGTTDYTGGLIARFMDGWVARLIDFEPARANYWNLMEIPKRLLEHAELVGEGADEAYMALQQLELNALEQAGAQAVQSELGDLRKTIDEHDDALEVLEEHLNKALEERARFIAGDDRFMQACRSRLTQAMDHEDLTSVHRYVRDTVSPTDDKIVLELQRLDSRLLGIKHDMGEIRQLHDNKIAKLKELEQVRRDFKNSRYDDVRSGFGNKALIASVLQQFLQGVVSGSDVWRVLQQNQRYRDIESMPDFGSGGLGDLLGDDMFNPRPRRRRSRRKSSWHIPSPRRGGGGFKFPRRGGGNDGGFTTGGGF